jgi:hypothetical protein
VNPWQPDPQALFTTQRAGGNRIQIDQVLTNYNGPPEDESLHLLRALGRKEIDPLDGGSPNSSEAFALSAPAQRAWSTLSLQSRSGTDSTLTSAQSRC